jgi:hypothetical protein
MYDTMGKTCATLNHNLLTIYIVIAQRRGCHVLGVGLRVTHVLPIVLDHARLDFLLRLFSYNSEALEDLYVSIWHVISIWPL